MKNDKTLFWQINEMSGVTLARKRIIPPYLSELWAKTHGGITPLWWKIWDQVAKFAWMVAAIAIVALGESPLKQYGGFDPKDRMLDLIILPWMMFVWIAFMIMHNVFGFFKKMRSNWKRFDYHLVKIAWLFYHDDEFPKTKEDFIDWIHHTLVARAKNQLREKPEEDCVSMSPLRETYDMAKAFGILKLGDSGYGPYFAEAQRELDQEEMPLFHQPEEEKRRRRAKIGP